VRARRPALNDGPTTATGTGTVVDVDVEVVDVDVDVDVDVVVDVPGPDTGSGGGAQAATNPAIATTPTPIKRNRTIRAPPHTVAAATPTPTQRPTPHGVTRKSQPTPHNRGRSAGTAARVADIQRWCRQSSDRQFTATFSFSGCRHDKVAAREYGEMGVLTSARVAKTARTRELPRDFRGICVRLFLTLASRKPHN